MSETWTSFEPGNALSISLTFMTTLLYLHGFNSSERSHKAQVLAEQAEQHGCRKQVITPRLVWRPEEAMAQLRQLIESLNGPITLVGSSLGGYYATYLSEQFGLPAVLINPAVRPYLLLEGFLGTQKNPYTGEEYVLTHKQMDELKAMDVENVTAARYWLMVQEGDEVLDFQQALEKYPSAKLTLETGGDHSFMGFERFLDDILRYAGLIR